MRKIHRARKTLAKITQGEKNTRSTCIQMQDTNQFIQNTGISHYFFFNYEGWFKSNSTDIIVFVARKKKIPRKFHCIYTLACLLYTRCSCNHSVTKGQFFTKDRSIASNKQSTTHKTAHASVYITSLANVTYRRYNVHWWSFKY